EVSATAQKPLAKSAREMRRLFPNRAERGSRWMNSMPIHAPIQIPEHEPSAVRTPPGLERKPAMPPAPSDPSHASTNNAKPMTGTVACNQARTMTRSPAIRPGSVVLSRAERLYLSNAVPSSATSDPIAWFDSEDHMDALGKPEI